MTNDMDRTSADILGELDAMIEDVSEVNTDDPDAIVMERVGNINGTGRSRFASMVVRLPNGQEFRINVEEL